MESTNTPGEMSYSAFLSTIPDMDIRTLARITQKPLLDTADVCFLFQRAPRTIRRWMYNGQIACSDIAGSPFFEWKDVMITLGNKRQPKH